MREGFTKFSQIVTPDEAQEPILAKPVRAALMDWLQEIWAAEDLLAVGLAERKRALFTGPAGTGKTTLAHHLAARLGLPMAIVRPDDIHGRFIGTGTSNIKAIFDAAAEYLEENNTPVLLFFDEFDTLAQKRMHSGVNEAVEHDHNGMVNSLLARLDAYDSYIIAATNQASAIDESVWRRFEIQIEVELPGQFERERILERYLDPFGLPTAELKALAESFGTATPALMRGFCENLKRQIVVGPKCGWNMHRDAVIERMLAAIQPHPDCGKPRLWTLGVKDHAVRSLTWPLMKASEIPAIEEAIPAPDDNVISLAGRS